MLAVGSVIGSRFRIDQVLGAGGMGIVVAATHLELGHRVAIKFLRDDMARSPTIVERFLREARSVVHLRTEHVCRVSDVGRLDSGAPYIVMELLEGSDLARAVARQPLPVTLAVEYVMQACIALAEAHRAGIIHRDLKPANLFVTRRLDGGPLVKVLDFGIAKALAETAAQLTHQAAMGSPGYMSPEQLQSARDVDHRTDIWALGVTLYQLLSARLPFAAATQTEIAVRVASDPPDPLDVDPALRAVVWRCLDKDRERRPPDVVALATELAPFGGPAARLHLTAIAQLAGATAQQVAVAPSLVSSVAMTSPTAASVPVYPLVPMASPTAASAPAPTAAPALPPRRRGGTIALVVVALALVIGGVALGLALRGGGATTSPVVAATRDSAASVPVADTGVPVADAQTIVAVATDAADPWASPDASPIDAGPPIDAAPPPDAGRPHRAHDKVYSIEELAAMQQNAMREACKQATDPAMADAMPPAMVVTCFCYAKDQARAARAYARLTSPATRKQMRAQCGHLGVTLPE